MAESLQHKLDRIRTPRVHITYDVEIGGALERRELAFVVGIMADLSGMREEDLPPLRERKFVEIDRDNFNLVLKAIRPHLHLSMPNKLGGDAEHRVAELYFEHFDDFDPLEVVRRVPELKALYDARSRLKDLMTKLDGNDTLNKMLTELMRDPSSLKALLPASQKENPEAGTAEGGSGPQTATQQPEGGDNA